MPLRRFQNSNKLIVQSFTIFAHKDLPTIDIPRTNTGKTCCAPPTLSHPCMVGTHSVAWYSGTAGQYPAIDILSNVVIVHRSVWGKAINKY